MTLVDFQGLPIVSSVDFFVPQKSYEDYIGINFFNRRSFNKGGLAQIKKDPNLLESYYAAIGSRSFNEGCLVRART